MVFNCKTISKKIPDFFNAKQDSPLNSVKNNNSPDEEANQMVSFFLIVRDNNYVNQVELFVKRINGVESVKRDGNSVKLGVTGKVDPVKIQEMVKHETNKEVDFIFPSAELKGDRDKNKGSKAKFMSQVMPIPENKVANEKTVESIIELKIKLCCESCNKKLRKILETKGLEMLTIEAENDLVSVKGTVDVTELRSCIKDKLNKDIEVVNVAKVMKGNGAVNKKDRDAGAVDKEYEGKCGGNMKQDVGAMKKSTVVFEIKLGCVCDGCIKNIRKVIRKFRGVETVLVAAGKDRVTVTGTMDVQELTSYLKEKIKSNEEVVLSKRKTKMMKMMTVNK